MGAEGQQEKGNGQETGEQGPDTPIDQAAREKMEKCLDPANPDMKTALENLSCVETQQALYDRTLALPKDAQAKALSVFFTNYPDYKLSDPQREVREKAEDWNVSKEDVSRIAADVETEAKRRGVDAHVADLFKVDYELNKTAMTTAMTKEFEATAYTTNLLPGLKTFLATAPYKPEQKTIIENNFHAYVMKSFRASFAEGPGHQFAFLNAKHTWDQIGIEAKGKSPMDRLSVITNHSRGMALRTGMVGQSSPETASGKDKQETTGDALIPAQTIKDICNVGAITSEQLGITADTYPTLSQTLLKPATPDLQKSMDAKFTGVFAANHLDTTAHVLRTYEEHKAGSTANPDIITLPSGKEFGTDIPKTCIAAVDGITPTEYGKFSAKLSVKSATETLKSRAGSIKEFIADIAGPEGMKILQEQGIGAFIMHILGSDMPEEEKKQVQEVVLEPTALAVGKDYVENEKTKPLEKLDQGGNAIVESLTKDEGVVVHPLTTFNGYTRSPDNKLLMKDVPAGQPNAGGLVYLDKNGHEVAVDVDRRDEVKANRPQDAVDLSQKTDEATFLVSHIHADILQNQFETKFGKDWTLNMPADFRKDKPYTQEEFNDPVHGTQKKQELMNDFVLYELKKFMTKDNKRVIDGTGGLVSLMAQDVAAGENAVNTATTSLTDGLYDKTHNTFTSLPQDAEYLKADGTWASATVDLVTGVINSPAGKVQVRMASAPRVIKEYKKETK